MTVESKAPTLDQLKAELRKVMNTDPINDGEMVRLTKAINKNSQDIVKAEAAKVLAETASLAGDREKLATEIWSGISSEVKAKLNKVKAKGYSFKLDDDGIQYKSVALSVPTAKKSLGGGSGGGRTKDETGLNLQEMIDQYGTDSQKVRVQKAWDDADTKKEGARPDSAKYQEQKRVKVEILKLHPELIKK